MSVEILLELLAIPGPSGKEGPVVEHIRKTLQRLGLSDEQVYVDHANESSPIGGNTGNLIVHLPGIKHGEHRMFVAHLDTVPHCVGCQPFLDGGFIRNGNPRTGLGADNRTGASVLLTTLVEILAGRLSHPPLTFLWTVQEELGMLGARHLNLDVLGKPKLSFNIDGGSATKITIGANGCDRSSISLQGIASHAGIAPQNGASAVVAASLAIASLHKQNLLGQSTVDGHTIMSNIGTISGGTAVNMVPDEVRIRSEIRGHIPAIRKRIQAKFQAAFQESSAMIVNQRGESVRCRIEHTTDYEAFQLSDEDPSVKALEVAIRKLGGSSTRAVTTGGVDANWLWQHGIPTASIGAGQVRAHTLEESVDLKQYLFAVEVAKLLATRATDFPLSMPN